MKHNMKKFIRNPADIRTNQSGATIIEFALVAPVFFLMLMALMEFGLIYFTTSVLEGAGAHGARIGKTGYSEGERVAYLRNQVIRLSGGYLNPQQIQITTLSYASHAEVGQIEPCRPPHPEPCSTVGTFNDINGNGVRDDRGIAGPGTRDQIVLYRITYNWPIFTPFIRHFIGNPTGHFPITTYTLVKNEGF